MKILITGSAGFIGYHLAKSLIERGDQVVGLDNINNYYDINIKYARLSKLGIERNLIKDEKVITSNQNDKFKFIKLDLSNYSMLKNITENENFDVICNLAAQAGVRYSLKNPHTYVESNIKGFLNILEASRYSSIKHLVYASSSSVYGLNENMPFSTTHNVDHPISLYAASKKSNELMAHTYSHLFNLPTTGLRFFTVYGPWGRPDMALFLFVKAILNNEEIKIFNNGKMERDFTYIDDIVEGIIKVIDNPAQKNMEWNAMSPDPSTSIAPFKVYNIGNNSPIKLLDFINEIELKLEMQAKKVFMDMQPGDVPKSHADISDLIENLKYQPKINYKIGISNFIDWYKDYYKIN